MSVTTSQKTRNAAVKGWVWTTFLYQRESQQQGSVIKLSAWLLMEEYKKAHK